jgi:DNA (cytosine-5)-methyltransferase 1
VAKYDRLIGATREALLMVGGPYVIENVTSAVTRAELRNPLMLCWTGFHTPGTVKDDDGTPLWMRRHRLFETNVPMWAPPRCAHPRGMQCAGAYGGARRDKVEARTIRKGGYVPQVHVMRQLLDTPWMSETGCRLSIPPAYTEWLGSQIIDAL